MKINISPEEFISKYWPYGLMAVVAILILAAIFFSPLAMFAVTLVLAMFGVGIGWLIYGFTKLITGSYADLPETIGLIFIATVLIIFGIDLVKMAVLGV